jgi:hypothetical protein
LEVITCTVEGLTAKNGISPTGNVALPNSAGEPVKTLKWGGFSVLVPVSLSEFFLVRLKPDGLGGLIGVKIQTP